MFCSASVMVVSGVSKQGIGDGGYCALGACVMTTKISDEWVLPASIPFDKLKGKDLEECVYWLFDAMGAKDLEWRIGGKGGGAADQGRDLEAHFYTPSIDGEIDAQKWWIECKGRDGTLEPQAVKDAVVNASAIEKLDYVVIVTNTTFSNPTRDWVKEWQKTHPHPKVRLWDHTSLERFLSRHPDVVLRLFAEALSPTGRLKAVEQRFWNLFEFSTQKALIDLWEQRNAIEGGPLAIFALIVNEFANGDIVARPWAATLDNAQLTEVLLLSLTNVPYLVLRGLKAGIEQKHILRALAYLVMAGLERETPEKIAKLISGAFSRDGQAFPDHVQEVLLLPILDQLLSELQDVCGSDCERMTLLDRSALTEDRDEIEDYWLRLELHEAKEDGKKRTTIRLEKYDAPCKVGFKTDKDHDCPLFAATPSLADFDALLSMLKRVIGFRKAQAAAQRKAPASKSRG